MRKTPEQRFWTMVASRNEGQCWLWTGRLDRKGYGSIAIAKKSTGAHRFSYELNVGPIPEGLVIDHLCRVRHCVNPAHLEPVTSAENTRRGLVGKQNNAMAQRTHCPKGHPYDEDNTYRSVRPSGRAVRNCRTCGRDGARHRYHATK